MATDNFDLMKIKNWRVESNRVYSVSDVSEPISKTQDIRCWDVRFANTRWPDWIVRQPPFVDGYSVINIADITSIELSCGDLTSSSITGYLSLTFKISRHMPGGDGTFHQYHSTSIRLTENRHATRNSIYMYENPFGEHSKTFHDAISVIYDLFDQNGGIDLMSGSYDDFHRILVYLVSMMGLY